MKLTSIIRTILAFVFMLACTQAFAQQLTAAQRTTLLNDINSRPAVLAMLQAADDQGVADFYNAPAQTGEFAAPLACWKPNYSVTALNASIDWAAFAALTQVRQNAYMAMTQTGVIDLSDNQVRAGITSIFGASSTSEQAIFSIDSTADRTQPERGARSATRFEMVHASGARNIARWCRFFGQLLTPQVVSNLR